MAVLSGYRLKAGWVTKTNIEADSSAAIENFTVQSDMQTGRVWQRPGNQSDVIDEHGEFVDSIDGHRGGYGNVEFTWELRALTPLMVQYILTTFFNSTDQSAALTARTHNRATGAFEVYQCIARRKTYSDLDPALGGYDNFVIEFVDGVINTT